jgi:hypothetical protein
LSNESRGRVDVARTHDVELVRRIHTHPRIYPWIVDDTCGPADRYDPSGICLNRFIYVLVPTLDGGPMGTATFLPRKKNPSQVAQAETPKPWKKSSLGRPSQLALAPVAMISASQV